MTTKLELQLELQAVLDVLKSGVVKDPTDLMQIATLSKVSYDQVSKICLHLELNLYR